MTENSAAVEFAEMWAAALFESSGTASGLQLFDCMTLAIGCQGDRMEKREDSTGCTIVLQFCTPE